MSEEIDEGMTEEFYPLEGDMPEGEFLEFDPEPLGVIQEFDQAITAGPLEFEPGAPEGIPGAESLVRSEGMLFLPEDDPFQVSSPPLVPDLPVVEARVVPRRLRHLVCEPKQALYKDPSGRYRPRG